MGMFKPSHLFPFLKENGIFAKKKLSQNFLIDGNIIQKIVSTAQVEANDLIIEIGPGPGALTETLLATGAKVIAIEKDSRLAAALSRLQTPNQTLQVFEQDFLNFELEAFLKSELKTGRKAKVISNLPYHLTTPILSKLVPMYSLISSLTVMVQKEVADRFIAKKNHPDYSSFSIFLQYYSIPKYCFTVEASCFVPKPKVRSAVVSLLLKPHLPPVPNEFFILTRKSFQMRRKMLKTSLKQMYAEDQVEIGLKHLNINPQARPENLSLDEFIHLYHFLSQKIDRNPGSKDPQ